MGKTGKWLRSFLTSSKKKNKDKEKNGSPASPSPSPIKEKRRWSFRRSVRSSPHDLAVPRPNCRVLESDFDHKRHAVAVAVATAAAADAAVAAAQAAAAAVIRLTAVGVSKRYGVEENAAIKVQAAFRAYLARKALRALKGLVKLQALVRGHLVRRQATAALRCMQALITVQARARAQRIQMIQESENISSHRQSSFNRRSTHQPRYRQSYVDADRGIEDNVKIVEMYEDSCAQSKLDPYQDISPAPSALTDISPRGCSGYLEDFTFSTAQSSPHYFPAVSQEESTYKSMFSEYPLFPSYMANTESSKAKARSQSAPKQRPDSYERQPSRRRQSVEGRNIPRSVRMQRSSSHIGVSVDEHQYPWSVKLDGSNVSLKNSECGSTSTVLTGGYYNRSLVSF